MPPPPPPLPQQRRLAPEDFVWAWEPILLVAVASFMFCCILITCACMHGCKFDPWGDDVDASSSVSRYIDAPGRDEDADLEREAERRKRAQDGEIRRKAATSARQAREEAQRKNEEGRRKRAAEDRVPLAQRQSEQRRRILASAPSEFEVDLGEANLEREGVSPRGSRLGSLGRRKLPPIPGARDRPPAVGAKLPPLGRATPPKARVNPFKKSEPLKKSGGFDKSGLF